MARTGCWTTGCRCKLLQLICGADMGLGALNDLGHPFWGQIASYPSAALNTAVSVADKLLPYATLITSSVAVLAGTIALYSIHVTRTIARKRATIDFFLKTEADKNILELFQNFSGHVAVVKKQIDDQKSASEIMKTSEYKTVHACLNMHELIAVGIEHKVFDDTVAYGFWNGALVGHCADASQIIDFSRTDASDLSAYISMLALNRRWKAKLDKWTRQQPVRLSPPIIVPGPVVVQFHDPEL
jgi:hypothetical protein